MFKSLIFLACLPVVIWAESFVVQLRYFGSPILLGYLNISNIAAERVVIGKMDLVLVEKANPVEFKSIMNKFKNEVFRWESTIKRYEIAVEFPKSMDPRRNVTDVAALPKSRHRHERYLSQFPFSRIAVQDKCSWGQYRTTNKNCVWSATPTPYYYDSRATGSEAEVFVLGSGLDADHREFEGRAKFMAVFANTTAPESDPWPYSSHVVSIVGGKQFGLAKHAQLRSIRIMDDDESVSAANIYRAIQFLLKNRDTTRHTVLLFTAFGPYSEIMNEAFNQVVAQNVYTVVAAGGWGYVSKDTCKLSPSGAKSVITIASSALGNEVLYSNYGKCISLFAAGNGAGIVPFTREPYQPGAGVWGSAQAGALAAGAIAILISKYSVAGLPIPSPSAMKDFLLNTSIAGEMKFSFLEKRKFPDRLLYLDPNYLIN